MDKDGIIKTFNLILENSGKLDIACNAILVICDIRPAFLVQSIDYGENTDGLATKGPVTVKILESLMPYFKIYETYQGFIISPKSNQINIDYYIQNNLMNSETIGELIGYPCSGDLHKDETRKYKYSVWCRCLDKTVNLMSVICGNEMDNWFNGLASAADNILNYICSDIDVLYEKQKLHNINDLIKKLKYYKSMNEDECLYILQIFENVFPDIYKYHCEKKINIYNFPNLEKMIKYGYKMNINYNDEECKLFQKYALDSYFVIND